MFGRVGKNVIIDLLFNLLLSFVILFILAFWMVSKKDEEEKTKNGNNILITMRWKSDNDMDLWLRLPDGRQVGYNKRDEPPAHLDVDVVSWRKYYQQDGMEYIIEDNEEIVTIRSVLEGEYAVNVHYYSCQSVKEGTPTEVEIMVQDVKNKSIVYVGKHSITDVRSETHFVKFSVVAGKKGSYYVKKVYTDRPTYFVGKGK